MKKIILNLMLVICFAACFMPVHAHAQTVESDSYSFNTETGELYIKNDAGTTAWRENPDIPKEDVKSVEFARLETPVLNIGESAFEGCVNLAGSIKMNAQAVSIGINAFKDCGKIDLMLIPEAVQGDIEASGLPDQVPYVVYAYDRGTFNFLVKDVHYGTESQIRLPDDNIYDGEWSCSGIYLICEDKFHVLPAEKGTAWYYHTEADGEVTVTDFVVNPDYRASIELPEAFGNLVIKQYADDAFSDTGLTAENVLIVEEGIKVNIPEEISRMDIVTENGRKVAYLTPGTSGTLDETVLHLLSVPSDVEILFTKDIMVDQFNFPMWHGLAVSYEERENGEIVITNVLDERFQDEAYTVPVAIKGNPVTAVMINTKYYSIDKLTVDGSVNQILYERDAYVDGGACRITRIVQGSGQLSVEIPADIGGYPVMDVEAGTFDKSVESICVPEGVKVDRPQSVCEISYNISGADQAVITDITPGTDDNGNMKTVSIPKMIEGKKVILTDEVIKEMANIPHVHTGGTATCKDQAVCSICQKPYGDLDKTNHVSETVVQHQKDPTCAEEGYTGDTVCIGCGQVLAAGKPIPKLAHQYKDGKCTVCGAADPSYKKPADTSPVQTDQNSTDSVKGTADVSNPRTGDTAPVNLLIAVLAAAFIVITVLPLYRRRHKDE